MLRKGSFTNLLSQKVIWSWGLFHSLRIHHQTSFVNILHQFQIHHFPSFSSLIQAESKEIFYIRIVPRKLACQHKNNQLNLTSIAQDIFEILRPVQQIQKKFLLSPIFFWSASTIRPLLPLILLQTISFVKDPSPTITNHLSQKVIWSFILFPSLRIHHQTSIVKISFILCQFWTHHVPSFASFI